MFDFEKLNAYSKAKMFNMKIKNCILILDSLNKTTKDELRRASLSIVLNIADSTSRFSDADKRNFYVIARGSLIEFMALLDPFERRFDN
jgi:four helix bundle protein